MSALQGKKIVIGITGSIAAYKIPLLARLLVREGAEVRIIMTPAATDFVTPLTMATLTRNPVIIEPFKTDSGEWNSHVDLGQWADLMLFAPVTANTLGKMAHGIADNFVITAYLSAKCPVFIAPAMDLDMYGHPSTQENIAILRRYGNTIIEPQTGELASGLSGPGRLEEPANILELISGYFQRSLDLDKKKVLITAGPTHENIDPVRFLANRSTGKMGFCLAEEAAERGASVTLVTGPTHLTCSHPSVLRIDIVTAAEMHAVCTAEAPSSDIVIMAAAVADYSPSVVAEHKIKKSGQSMNLELTATRDILFELGKNKPGHQILCGFALETDNETENARGKMVAKNLDCIVLNSLQDKGAGFGLETNKVTLIDRSGNLERGELGDKRRVAGSIIDFIVNYGKKSL